MSHIDRTERTPRRGEQRVRGGGAHCGRPKPDAFQEQDVCLSSLNEGANVGRGSRSSRITPPRRRSRDVSLTRRRRRPHELVISTTAFNAPNQCSVVWRLSYIPYLEDCYILTMQWIFLEPFASHLANPATQPDFGTRRS